jgi:hypothetical protein
MPYMQICADICTYMGRSSFSADSINVARNSIIYKPMYIYLQTYEPLMSEQNPHISEALAPSSPS